jgi:serine/threonine protein kinase
MSNTQIIATAVISDRPTDRSPLSSDAVSIAGYQLQERIGVGGYGEVWRAVGPGGFPKAVKILYGQVDGPQAETELKSLNLMRELRHPFLLNVERVEFVNSRVVVVTELADRSLDQRFDEAVKAGVEAFHATNCWDICGMLLMLWISCPKIMACSISTSNPRTY